MENISQAEVKNSIPEWLAKNPGPAVSTPAVAGPPIIAAPQTDAPRPFPSEPSLPLVFPGLSIDLTTKVDAFGKLADVDVKLVGNWDGKMIKAVVKKIEREYKFVKHNMVRAMVKHKVASQRADKQKE